MATEIASGYISIYLRTDEVARGLSELKSKTASAMNSMTVSTNSAISKQTNAQIQMYANLMQRAITVSRAIRRLMIVAFAPLAATSAYAFKAFSKTSSAETSRVMGDFNRFKDNVKSNLSNAFLYAINSTKLFGKTTSQWMDVISNRLNKLTTQDVNKFIGAMKFLITGMAITKTLEMWLMLGRYITLATVSLRKFNAMQAGVVATQGLTTAITGAEVAKTAGKATQAGAQAGLISAINANTAATQANTVALGGQVAGGVYAAKTAAKKTATVSGASTISGEAARIAKKEATGIKAGRIIPIPTGSFEKAEEGTVGWYANKATQRNKKIWTDQSKTISQRVKEIRKTDAAYNEFFKQQESILRIRTVPQLSVPKGFTARATAMSKAASRGYPAMATGATAATATNVASSGLSKFLLVLGKFTAVAAIITVLVGAFAKLGGFKDLAEAFGWAMTKLGEGLSWMIKMFDKLTTAVAEGLITIGGLVEGTATGKIFTSAGRKTMAQEQQTIINEFRRQQAEKTLLTPIKNEYMKSPKTQADKIEAMRDYAKQLKGFVKEKKDILDFDAGFHGKKMKAGEFADFISGGIKDWQKAFIDNQQKLYDLEEKKAEADREFQKKMVELTAKQYVSLDKGAQEAEEIAGVLSAAGEPETGF